MGVKVRETLSSILQYCNVDIFSLKTFFSENKYKKEKDEVEIFAEAPN